MKTKLRRRPINGKSRHDCRQPADRVGKSFWYHCRKCKPYWRAVAMHKRALLTHQRAQVAYEHARAALAAAEDEQHWRGQQLTEAM